MSKQKDLRFEPIKGSFRIKVPKSATQVRIGGDYITLNFSAQNIGIGKYEFEFTGAYYNGAEFAAAWGNVLGIQNTLLVRCREFVSSHTMLACRRLKAKVTSQDRLKILVYDNGSPERS